jgi:hypothetical protein
LRAIALCFRAGVGEVFLASSTAADRALYLSIAEAALEVRAEETTTLARAIRNEVADMLG